MRNTRRLNSRIVIPALIAVLVLVGVPVFAGGAAEEAAVVEQDLVIAIHSDIVSLDPHGSNDSPSSQVRTQIYDTLLYHDEDLQLHAGLAVDWEMIEDTVWEFRLRDGVTFHNGDRFTADAVKANLDRITDPEYGSQRAFLYTMISEVRVVDDLTVQIETEYPFAPLLAHLAHDAGGIAHPGALDEAGFDEVEPIGTGPFSLERWEPGDEIVLRRNDAYWGDLPNVDSVTFQIVPEESTRLAMVERGDAHIADILQPANIGRAEGSGAMDAHLYESLSLTYVSFNTQTEPFDDVRVRQAITMAMDKESIIEGIVEGAGTPAVGPINELVFGAHPELADLELPYDPDRAQELLAEAGYPDGFETTVWTNDNPTRIAIAEVMQHNLAEVGIDVSIEVLEWGAYLDETAEGNHDMFILGWVTVTGDADYGMYALFHSDNHGAPGNRSFYTQERVDELLDAGRTEGDVDAREELYFEVQEYLVNDAPFVYLYHPFYMLAIGNNIEGYRHRPDNMPVLTDVIITD